MSALETVAWRAKWPSDGLWTVCPGAIPTHFARCWPEAKVEPLTPLAPAQAEIERLRAVVEGLTEAGLNQLDLLTQTQARALAAEEQVRVLSEALERLVETIEEAWPSLSVLPPIKAARAALQHKDNQHGR